jgi:hypothetical protein
MEHEELARRLASAGTPPMLRRARERRQAQPPASPPGLLSRVAKLVLSAKAALLLAASVGVVLALRAPHWDSVVVERIGLPKELVDAGYSSQVVTAQFVRELSDAAQSAEWGRLSTFGKQITLGGERLNAEFVSEDASRIASAVLRLARTFTNSDRLIQGEVRKTGTGTSIVLLAQNGLLQGTVRCPIKPDGLDAALAACATQLIETVAPELALVNTLAMESHACDIDSTQCEFAQTLRISKQMREDAEPRNDKWAAVGVAFAKGRKSEFEATEALKPVIASDPDFVPAQVAWASYSMDLDDAKRLALLRELAKKEQDFLGVDLQLFVTLFRTLRGDMLSPYPLNRCFARDHATIIEMEAIRVRMQKRPGALARRISAEMEGMLAMLTARNYGALLIHEALVADHPNDAVLVTMLGDVYWYQTSIETSPDPVLKYARLAEAQYQAAIKLAPNFEAAKERLKLVKDWIAMVDKAAKTNTFQKGPMDPCVRTTKA